MDGFLKRRREDPRFTNERRVTGVQASNVSWYNEAPRAQVHEGGGGLVRSRHRFAEEKKAKDSSSGSGSESDGEGGRRKKKKSGKSKGNAPGYDGPDKCWDGYKKVPGKMRGEKGSCEKA